MVGVIYIRTISMLHDFSRSVKLDDTIYPGYREFLNAENGENRSNARCGLVGDAVLR